ncbi:ketosynthase chain-length factor [Streptomyces sp. NRRL B-1347]|uniref:ketosynthase chain-length factor n=1 Tax=Streptomyces sp. NRRL B-1347 TaxID=1476877 RepID=UPI0007C57ED1|nr:ketosynthase chain-length factor [Streptomyces sp. NRRL B-1347]
MTTTTTASGTGERTAAAAEPVFTGMSVIAPNGIGVDAYWRAVLSGTSGIGPISRFDPSRYPVRLAGQVADFPLGTVPSRLVPETDRMTHFALAAAQWALQDARLDPADLGEYGGAVVTANSSGGFEFGQHQLENLWTRGGRAVSAYHSIAWFYAASTGQISIRHKLRGHCGVLATEQAGGIDAAAQARRVLRDGGAMVLTGGTDASLSPWGFVTQLATGLLSTEPDPARAYLPFARQARGYVPGEGGAVLVMEPAEAARRRGAPQVYGRLGGYAATTDPPPGSPRPPALRRAVTGALADAGLAPGDIDVVFADATGVPEHDAREARALAEVFGPYGVPVTAPKSMTGRLYAGAALDIATALLALHRNVIPPTTGVSEPDPAYRLDLVTGGPRERPLRNALVLARGYGGFNAALVLRAADEPGHRAPEIHRDTANTTDTTHQRKGGGS